MFLLPINNAEISLYTIQKNNPIFLRPRENTAIIQNLNAAGLWSYYQA